MSSYFPPCLQTYTMTGPTSDTFVDQGLCMRTAACLFERARKVNSKENNTISIRLSVVEIYNENMTDLLRNSTSTSASRSATPANQQPQSQIHQLPTQHTQKLSIVDTVNGIIIPGLYLLPLSSEDEAYELLFEAYSNRVVAEHQLNRRSSRSHVIYTFYVTKTRILGERLTHLLFCIFSIFLCVCLSVCESVSFFIYS